MSGLQLAAVITGGVIGLLTVIMLIGRLAGAGAARRSGARVEDLGLGGSARRTEAVSLGVTSRGKGQVRGNGTLALGDSELVFVLAVPLRETRIPLRRITEVGTRRSHLGKWIGRTLLYVAWTSDAGEDSIAMWVRDLPAWIAAIEAARARA